MDGDTGLCGGFLGLVVFVEILWRRLGADESVDFVLSIVRKSRRFLLQCHRTNWE